MVEHSNLNRMSFHVNGSPPCGEVQVPVALLDADTVVVGQVTLSKMIFAFLVSHCQHCFPECDLQYLEN